MPSHPRESEGEDDLPYCSHYDHVTTIHKTGVHLHFRDNWLLCSGQRFWEIAAATIEERLRIYGSKTRCFCPSVSKATRIKASLSSPSERNHARSASLTVFSPYSLRQARESDGVRRRGGQALSYGMPQRQEFGKISFPNGKA